MEQGEGAAERMAALVPGGEREHDPGPARRALACGSLLRPPLLQVPPRPVKVVKFQTGQIT